MIEKWQTGTSTFQYFLNCFEDHHLSYTTYYAASKLGHLTYKLVITCLMTCSSAAAQLRDDDRLLTGFKECRDVAIRYLVEQHGHDIVGPLCTGMIVHLHEHLHSICRVSNQTTGALLATMKPPFFVFFTILFSSTTQNYGGLFPSPQ